MAVLDYHIHSDYSDGTRLEDMVQAASQSEISGVGVADHCNVTSERIRAERDYFFHESYRLRRKKLRELRNQYDISIFDAVEVDYYPHDERRISEFLEDADFDYTIGSIHYINDRHVADKEYFEGKTHSKRSKLVDSYIDSLVQLIESELFDIAAHLDVLERYQPFQNLLTDSHFSDVADALAESRTKPEINVGRLFSQYGKTHPKPEFIDYLDEQGIEFTFGTDAHTPETLHRGVEYYWDVLSESEYTFSEVNL